MKPIFNKHKYIKVITFQNNKKVKIDYKKDKKFDLPILINNNHVFQHNQFRTILTTDKASETINPLDFKSAYKADDFTSAIESKLIKETFTNLQSSKFDFVKVLLIVNAAISAIILLLFYQNIVNKPIEPIEPSENNTIVQVVDL